MGIPLLNKDTFYLPEALRLINAQSGTGTLVAGTLTITGVTLTVATSIIQITMRDPGAGALTTGIGFDAPVASRTATQFVVNYIANDKTTLATAVCTFDWLVLG
jgi:hypothetical protein